MFDTSLRRRKQQQETQESVGDSKKENVVELKKEVGVQRVVVRY